MLVAWSARRRPNRLQWGTDINRQLTLGRPMKVFLQLVSALCISCAPALAAEGGAPNIVFILADDLGLGDLGCYGGTAIPTPHIDRLAAEGLRFTNAYSASAVCAPTRCGLMTGKH